MKNPLIQLSIIFCCLICFNVLAQPGHNPGDPDLPCNFEIAAIYGESGHSLVGEYEYYGICSVHSEESAIAYEVLHIPTGYTIQNYTPGSPCIEVWGSAVETGIQSIIIAASTPEGCQDTLTITHNYQCMTAERIAPEPAAVNHGAVNQYYNQRFFIEYTPYPLGLPFHFNITSGSLPPGLVLLDSGYYDTFLRGTPTRAGEYTFTLRAYLGNNCTAVEQEYTIVIDENPECAYFDLYIAYSENTYTTVGIPEYYSICGGGAEPVQFTAVSLLPGYTISSSGSACGDLNGTVEEAGTFSMKIAGTNSLGCTDTLTITNTWTCANAEFDPYEFPAFRVGQDVHEGLLSAPQSSLGVPVKYEVTAGTLPPGLSLEPGMGLSFYDGDLSGEPTMPGIYTFTIRAYLGSNCAGFTRTYTVQVVGGYAPLSLVLTPRCADSIAVRNWEIYNPNQNAYILVNWELLYEPSYQGTLVVPPGYTTFQTPNIIHPNTIRISWQDGITGTKTLIRGASSELCNPPVCVIGASIITYHQGFQKNGQAVPAQFSDPLQALGEPDASDSPSDPPRHFSLGYNGFIVLELSSNLYDQPGNDLIVHEMSFGDPSFSSHPERAEVFVSQNGTQWVSIGITGYVQDCNAPLDKAFDLAGKITWCRYVKIVDKTDRHARILTPITCAPTNAFAFDGFTNGFDVDAVTCGSYTSTLASARIASEQSSASTATEYILYPNPVNDWVTIDLSQERELVSPESKEVQVDIRDMSGRSVYTQLHTLDPDLKTRCNLSGFQSGLFVLHVRTSQGARFYKLAKQ